MILAPTDFARSVLAKREENDPQASFSHEYVKRTVSEKLRRDSYKVVLESARTKSSGRMDIHAAKGKRIFAVEIETGKSDVVSNVKRDLLEGVSEVWVIAVNDKAMKEVERQLAKAGLILPKRVFVKQISSFMGREAKANL